MVGQMTTVAEPDGPLPDRTLSRPLADIARETTIDPRVPALVPGFDAPFFQAGLAGYSDAPMRLMARRHGCPFCVTEALLDRTLISGGKGRTREDPDLLAEQCGTGDLEENRAAGLEDHPIAGQLMGTQPEEMARGAEILLNFGYEVVDLNFACPVKKVKRRNRGGHFLAHPEEAIAVFKAVREVVPDEVPITVKLRRAWDDTEAMTAAFHEVFDAIYDLGAAWATVHCRTVEQRYKGPGRWSFLAELRAKHPDRLFFGSGDIWTAEDVFAMLDVTGATGVSVARGCIGNPWIFRQCRQMMAGQAPTEPTLAEQRDVLLEHLRLSTELHGERGASKMMRKFGIRFAKHHPEGHRVKADFIACDSRAAWHRVLEAHYPTDQCTIPT